jgi:hypothetical protein
LIDYATKYCLAVTIGPTSRALDAVVCITSEQACEWGLLRWSGPNWLRRLIRVVTSRSGSSAPAGFRFPREVIAVAVRWYLRYGLS